MPKFKKVWQNPPRLAKFWGMVHCTCCANSTKGFKFIQVLPSTRKGAKKTITSGSGIGGEPCSDTKKVQISS